MKGNPVAFVANPKVLSANLCAVALVMTFVACGGPQGSNAAAETAVAPHGPQGTPRVSQEVLARVQGAVERYDVPVDASQPIRGAADALVTIVVFSDFECPFCRRVLPTLARLDETYPGKVRVVWRNLPLNFHRHARPAATAAAEAFAQKGNEAFWAMHDLLFDNPLDLDHESLLRYGDRIGLDRSRLKAALEGRTHEGTLDEDSALSSQLGVTGTPAFFLNGRPLSGARPFREFQAIVEDEIRRGEELLQAGIPRAEVYVALTQGRPTKSASARERRPRRRPRRVDDETAVYRVPLTGSEPSRGSKDALVTIVAFSDFQCPFCARVLPTIEAALDRYGSDLRLVWMNNPLAFHEHAYPAATAALEAHAQAGDKAFWAYHDLLFANQRSLGRDRFVAFGRELKLNTRAIEAALDEDRYRAVIDAQQDLARSLGATGTPAFFINGRHIGGAQPLHVFMSVIDEELARAKALVAAGTPRDQVYARAIADGKTSPQYRVPDSAGRPSERDRPRVYAIAAAPRAPYRGGKKAKVEIHLFSDFQCPFCARARPLLDEIEKHYGDRVRIIWRNFPLSFHPDAPLAAQAALEVHAQAGNAKFWQYHDLLFENQHALSASDLEGYAEQVGGVNRRRFRAALKSRKHESTIAADMAAVAQAIEEGFGTPAFFINGRLILGAQPFEVLKATIDEALAETAGTKPGP